MAELEVPNSVSKITLGGDTVWQNSDGWIPLKLPDGVSGNVFFKDYGDGTAGLVGSLGYLTQATSDSLYTPSFKLLNPPNGYTFLDHNWQVGPSYGPTILVYTSMYTTSGSNQAVQRGYGYISFADGNVTVVRAQHNSNLYGKIRVLINFNGNDINHVSATDDNFGGPAIIGLEKV
ncbi:hypothetical protein [Levilactobacillus angrenensis]|uniref:Uncharacterized protein n=1 Tax=Levilactobacillus angrenensis TaxID=2486020 RepID=A0ABW1UBI5_9LACO|nr:hypothetical protein [Levilactobacillus angrenensis]